MDICAGPQSWAGAARTVVMALREHQDKETPEGTALRLITTRPAAVVVQAQQARLLLLQVMVVMVVSGWNLQ